jgi:hypothetical protein
MLAHAVPKKKMSYEVPDESSPSLAARHVGLLEPDPWSIPGVIGEALARHAETADRLLQSVEQRQNLNRNDIRTLQAAARAVRRIAMSSQQISRLAGGRLRQSHERLALHEVVRQVIKENDWQYYQAGVMFEEHLQPVEIIVDPGLLVSLCEALIDCAMRHGQVLTCWLKVSNWPQNGVLTLRARPHVPDPRKPLDGLGETLEWILVTRLALAMGVTAIREVFADYAVFTLEFPRTVTHLEGLTAVEVDADSDSLMSGHSKPFAGHRILLVTGDAQLRWELEAICKDMRLSLDTVPSAAQAVRYCEHDKPDAIVVDERRRDALFDQLRTDLMRYDVNFPTVEITSDGHGVAMSGWDGNNMSRVSRDALRAQLPSLLAVELAKVF